MDTEVKQETMHVGAWVTTGYLRYIYRVREYRDGLILLTDAWRKSTERFERDYDPRWVASEDYRIVHPAGKGPGEEIVETGIPAIDYSTGKAEVDNLVITPAHYSRFAIEPITFIMKNDLQFEIGSVVKYVCRAGYKQYDDLTIEQSEVRDLEKAKRMIDMRLNKLNGSDVL